MSNIVTFYPVFPIPKENFRVHFAKSSEDKGEVPPQFIAVQKQPARPLSTPPVSSTLSPPGLHAIGNLHSHSNRVWAVQAPFNFYLKWVLPVCCSQPHIPLAPPSFNGCHSASIPHFWWWLWLTSQELSFLVFMPACCHDLGFGFLIFLIPQMG